MMLLLLAFLGLVGSAFAGFIEITEPGVYDFKGKLISMAPNSNSPAIVIGDSKNQSPALRVFNITLKNLVIDGNKSNQSSEYCDEFPYLRNNGITIRGASNVIVENVTVINARSGGIVLERDCQNIIVRNSTVVGSYYDGVAACETKNSEFSNLVLINNSYAAISLDWWVSSCRFRNITSLFNQDWTIFLRASQNIYIDSLMSIGNAGSIFAAINQQVPHKNHVTLKMENSFLLDFRRSFIGENCYFYE
jgi:pectate lyase